ncbi:MAG: helix-turn-helix transcriptional regulator [Candidatus Nezhaarchaeales archaeon]
MKKSRIKLLILVIICLTISMTPLYFYYAQEQETKVSIEVYSNGAAYVTMKISNVTSENISLTLIGTPEPDYILVYDEENIPLPYNLSNSVITIYPVGSSTITVEYVTYSICSMSMGIWSININSSYDFTLILPSEVEVTYINTAPTSISTQDNKLIMTFSKGSIQVDYLIPATLPQQEQQAQTNGTTQTQTEGGGEIVTPPLIPWNFLAIGIVIVAVIAVAAVIMTRRRTASLSGVESAIINYLKNRGGSAFQDEISRELSIPKSTLSRAINSLKSKGIIEVKKVSRRNYITLT